MKILQFAGLYLVLLCPSNQNSHTGFYVITTTNHSISSSRVQLHSILTSRSRSHALLHSTMTSHSSHFVFREQVQGSKTFVLYDEKSRWGDILRHIYNQSENFKKLCTTPLYTDVVFREGGVTLNPV
ncbi:hypothetical protein NPIL_96111 [Nephila pilipes]|uniref:Salivary secreted peptide n=1 Tax=Nephila pilipes TaxID=299642 RepID=A0A8X6QIN4_NEPPI|nr:hypothetical protein NPIL_96111 [Nephila pilipes]